MRVWVYFRTVTHFKCEFIDKKNGEQIKKTHRTENPISINNFNVDNFAIFIKLFSGRPQQKNDEKKNKAIKSTPNCLWTISCLLFSFFGWRSIEFMSRFHSLSSFFIAIQVIVYHLDSRMTSINFIKSTLITAAAAVVVVVLFHSRTFLFAVFYVGAISIMHAVAESDIAKC